MFSSPRAGAQHKPLKVGGAGVSSELMLLRPASGPGCSSALKELLFWQLIFCGVGNFAVGFNADALLGKCDSRAPGLLQKWRQFDIIES